MLSYIGPGGALSAIGTFLALLAATLLALLGFVWYPIKRLLRARKSKAANPGTQSDAAADSRSALSSPISSSPISSSPISSTGSDNG
jgi:hypothetical protein